MEANTRLQWEIRGYTTPSRAAQRRDSAVDSVSLSSSSSHGKGDGILSHFTSSVASFLKLKAPKSRLKQAASFLRSALQSGIHKDYDLTRVELGRGHYGVVRVGVHRQTGRQAAVKIVPRVSRDGRNEVKYVTREIQIMKEIDHPNCVLLYDVYESRSEFFLCMEPVTGGQLLERIIAKDHYSEHEAASCFVQIMSAVHYLHSIGIIHRDLKPENVLYASEAEDAPIKLCDFGLGRVMVEADQNAQGRERFYSRCGSPDYVAPEVLTRVGYGRECDVWSCGCILYVLLCGFAPFTETENVRKFKQIEQGQFDFPKPFWLHVSEDAKDLISQMLRVDPEQRASAEEVLSHHWVTAFRAGTSDTTAMPGLQERLASFAAARNVHRAINVCSALARMSSENRARFAPADCAGALARVAAEPELEQALRDIFRVLDRSGAGAVTEADLDHALDAVGRPACLASAAEMLRHLDVCDRGAFGFSEFCVLMTSPAVTTNGSPLVPASPAETPELKPAMWGVAEERSMPCAEWRAGTGMGISGMLSNEEIREAYEALDVTHAGVITAEDMREVLRRFGFEVTEEESEEMVRCADAKQRGHIDLEDFVSFCRAPSTPILRSPLAANEKPPPLVPRLGPSSRAVPTLDADVTTGAVLAADWRDDSLLAHAGSTGKDAAGAAQPAGSQPSWQEIPEEPCSGGLSPRVGAGQAGTGGQQCHFSLPGEKPGDGPHSEVPLASLGARNLGADLAPRAVANVLG